MPRSTRPTLFDYIQQSESFRLADGEPCVADLAEDVIEQDGQPYMRRFFLLGQHSMTGGSTARYHQILQSDQLDMHDHPWDFVSVILSGSYVETTPDGGEQEYGPGSVLVRSAEQLHRLTLVNRQPVWTFVTLGPVRRRWGYQTADGWVDWRTHLTAPANIPSATAVWTL